MMVNVEIEGGRPKPAINRWWVHVRDIAAGLVPGLFLGAALYAKLDGVETPTLLLLLTAGFVMIALALTLWTLRDALRLEKLESLHMAEAIRELDEGDQAEAGLDERWRRASQHSHE